MNSINDFLLGRSVQKQNVYAGVSSTIHTNKRPAEVKDEGPSKPKRKKYANNFVTNFKEEVFERFKKRGISPDIELENTDIYRRYNFEYKTGPKLAISDYRRRIVETVKENVVTVLEGPTGCGKTTQVPQYILDYHQQKGLRCNIIIAQPRRIAAKNNSIRVCHERGWKCGSIVGYQVGSDQQANRSADTRILFCTTGVLVEKLIHNNDGNPLDEFTHIILDEVHERDKDMDFLMIIVYKYLNPYVRVILMSATIDSERFAKYYDIPYTDRMMAPIIKLDVQRNFRVDTFYIDDFDDVVHEENIKEPQISEKMYQFTSKLIIFFERLDRIESRASGISDDKFDASPKPTVLVFLPGIFEIKQMYNRLEKWGLLNQKTQLVRIIMHSTVEDLHSELAMQSLDKNVRKILLATNIAESSITVPDVKYVIDFCLTKTLITNSKTNFPSLQLQWATHSNCEQRKGRAGRVMPGKCFRLVTKHFFHTKLGKIPVKPELQTNPLENIVLKAKQLNFGKPEEILALAMDKPELNDIANTVIRLKEIGALLCTTNGKIVDRDGDLTFIGEIMTRLPIDVKLSKFILLGYCFGVMDECIIIAAALNCTKQMFARNMKSIVESYTKYLEFANGSGSDLFALLNAYRTWQRLRDKGFFGNINSNKDRDEIRKAEKEWAKKNCLGIGALYECHEYVRDLHVRIKRLKLVPQESDWNERERYVVLKVVISGGFYPNFYSRGTKLQNEDTKRAYDKLSGRDPTDTVYFEDCPKDILPHIYMEKLRQIFIDGGVIGREEAHKIKFSQDGGSRKLYVTFKRSGKEDDLKNYGVACQPGFVLSEVYKSVKMRTSSIKPTLNILSNQNVALNYAEHRGLEYNTETLQVRIKEPIEYESVCLPRKLDTFVLGHITNTDNCGRFWIQPVSRQERLREMFNEMNNRNNDLVAFKDISEIKVGKMLAAAFVDENNREEYYRATVVTINGTKSILVEFIDFGNMEERKLSQLKSLRGVANQFLVDPPHCFQCSPALIQPSQIRAPDGIWPTGAKKSFVRKTDGKEVKIEVYSVVHGVVRAIVYLEGENINRFLLREGYAENCDENYMSKMDHLDREEAPNAQDQTNYLTRAVVDHLMEEDIPTIKGPTRGDGEMHEVPFKGPFSPLEIQLHGTSRNTSYQIKVDPQSVNSVLLENQPNDITEKHLVAALATKTDDESCITVRQTTLLPNINAFVPLMAAIFAPRIGFIRNKYNTTYCRMTAGLGCYDDGQTISPNSDLTFNLDAEITNNDLIEINGIRCSMNKIFRQHRGGAVATVSHEMKKIQSNLITLLSTRRSLIADEYVGGAWIKYDKSDIYYSEQSSSRKSDIFPEHKMLKLYPLKPDRLSLLLENHKKLVAEKRRGDICTSTKCLLCNKENIDELRLHLMSRQHTDILKSLKNSWDNVQL